MRLYAISGVPAHCVLGCAQEDALVALGGVLIAPSNGEKRMNDVAFENLKTLIEHSEELGPCRAWRGGAI